MAKSATKRREWTEGAHPDLEDDGSKEKNSVEYRPETEANRGCDSAKGFQYGVVARLSDLEFALSSRPAEPRSVRGFLF